MSKFLNASYRFTGLFFSLYNRISSAYLLPAAPNPRFLLPDASLLFFHPRAYLAFIGQLIVIHGRLLATCLWPPTPPPTKRRPFSKAIEKWHKQHLLIPRVQGSSVDAYRINPQKSLLGWVPETLERSVIVLSYREWRGGIENHPLLSV